MSHTRFSDEELKLILADERNCVRLEKGIKHIGIHPYYLNNVAIGITENLNKTVSKYDKAFKGIILTYKNPKLLQSNGTVHNDKGHIFVDVEAEFYIFCPHEDSLVKATVNKTGQDHIGCLIHKAFNISVPKPSNDLDWKGRLVETGDEILIKINYVDMFYIIPYIKGEIVDILVKSIKCEIEDDSGISTNESTKTKKKINIKKRLNSSDIQLGKENIHKLKKSKLNKVEDIKNHSLITQIKKENIDDINVETHNTPAKIKSKKRRNTMHETVPFGEGNKIDVKLSPISKSIKIEANNNSIDNDNDKIERMLKKIKSNLKSDIDLDKSKRNSVGSTEYEKNKVKSPRKIKSEVSPSDNLSKKSKIHAMEVKLKSKDDIELTKASNNDEKKLKGRRKTVSELLPIESLVKEQKKKKLNTSLNAIDDTKISDENKPPSPKKLKKSKRRNTLDVSDIGDIEALRNKVLESVIKEISPKKKKRETEKISSEESIKKKSKKTDISSEVVDKVENTPIKLNPKKRKKKDSVDTPPESKDRKESSKKQKISDDNESGLKKVKSKNKKSEPIENKYPSLQLNTPQYVDYIPTNEVSTFHDSISPIKMKDRPNLSSPETRKYTTPVDSEDTFNLVNKSTGSSKTKKLKKLKQPSSLLSDFHRDLISKYLSK